MLGATAASTAPASNAEPAASAPAREERPRDPRHGREADGRVAEHEGVLDRAAPAEAAVDELRDGEAEGDEDARRRGRERRRPGDLAGPPARTGGEYGEWERAAR